MGVFFAESAFRKSLKAHGSPRWSPGQIISVPQLGPFFCWKLLYTSRPLLAGAGTAQHCSSAHLGSSVPAHPIVFLPLFQNYILIPFASPVVLCHPLFHNPSCLLPFGGLWVFRASACPPGRPECPCRAPSHPYGGLLSPVLPQATQPSLPGSPQTCFLPKGLGHVDCACCFHALTQDPCHRPDHMLLFRATSLSKRK